MTKTEPGSENAVATFLMAMPPERREALHAQAPAGREAADRRTSSGKPAVERPPHGVGEQTAAKGDQMLPDLRRQVVRRHQEDEDSRHFVRMSKIEAISLHWLSPGRIAAGKITILDGDPGLGKSTLLCEWAARVTRGEALPGGEREEPRTVLLLSAEDDLYDTIRPRLDAAGGDAELVVSVLSMPDRSNKDRPIAIPGDVWLLEELATRLDVALIIIDPLVAFLHGSLNANSDQDVRRALASLKGVGERTGAAIVAVRHLNKSAGANPLYRGGGSIGIIGAARCGLLLAADPDDPERRILAATKGNLGKPPPSLAFRLAPDAASGVARVVWEGETRWTASQLLRAADDEEREERSALGEARAWLRAELADGPRPAKEIEAAAAARGFSTVTIVRARKAEGVVSRKARGRNGGWMWSVHDQATEGDQAPGSDHLDRLDRLDNLPLPETSSEPDAATSSGDAAGDPWDQVGRDRGDAVPSTGHRDGASDVDQPRTG